MINRFFAIIAVLLFFCLDILAQNQNSSDKLNAVAIQERMLDEFSIRYPLLRQGVVATDFLGRGNVKAKFQGQDVFNGDAQITRIRSNFNVPLSQWGKNRINGTISFQQQRIEMHNVNSFSDQITENSGDINKSALGLTLTYSRNDSIFGRPVILSAGIAGTTDELSSIKRLSYIGSITFPLKRTQTRALSLGAVIFIDRASLVPFIPILSYWQKFESPGLELFVDIPSRVAVRKQFSKRSWMFVGSEMTNSIAFFNLSQPLIPQNATMTTLDIKTNVSLEYLLTKKFVVGVNGGLFSSLRPRMFDSNKNSNDFFFETNNRTVPYIGFSVSFLPFLKALK